MGNQHGALRSAVHTCGCSSQMNMETTTFSGIYTWYFLMITGLCLLVDGWLMFDGLRYICFFDVTSSAWKTPLSRSARQRNQRVSCATSETLPNAAYDFEFGVHTTDSDGRPTAGAQVLTRVTKVPWHPYHSGPALHCRVPSRSERCFTLQKR